MSSPEERLVIQTRMLVDEVISANNSAHQEIKAEMSREVRGLSALVMRHTKKWSVLAALVTFVGVALPVYQQVRVASANAEIATVAREATRQEFLRLQQSREVELDKVAERAAERAVRLVTVPQDTIRSGK